MSAEVLANIISAGSLIATVLAFCCTQCKSKKAETIKRINDIYDFYYEICEKDFHEHYFKYVHYMSEVERFAVYVNEGVYNKHIVEKQMSIFLASQYDRFMREIIEQRRKQFGRDSYYKNIEDLIKSFEK